ncbi:NAD(P)-binding protein [Saccharomonospora sp. CUA-673]|uniref:NAD(P)-binding protein n=1 Tax=Saccharomonospora sp. CUA-673 TaxID=1904969 RepID=UPI00096A62F2|nr:NAD(P)-binding protein [Saccharomonospora sp. CUA-673]
MPKEITVVGGGLAGLVAAVEAAERGAKVTLHEAHSSLGGRGGRRRVRTSPMTGRTCSTPTGRIGHGWSTTGWSAGWDGRRCAMRASGSASTATCARYRRGGF